MWFDVGAARARRRGEALPPANPASHANPPAPACAHLAGLAELAGGTAHPADAGVDAYPAAPDLADRLYAAEERAAVMEYDGGLPRAEAERLALAGVSDPEARRVLTGRWRAGK